MERNIVLPRVDSGRNNNVNSPTMNNNKFQDAYNDVNNASNLIKARLEKLKREKELLNGLGRGPWNSNMNAMRNMARNKQIMMNPNLYANQYIDPIYYPLEMPVNAEPVTLPKIELGQPICNDDHSKNNGGLNISDILAVIAAMKGPQMAPYMPPQQQTPIQMPQYDPPPKKKGKVKVIKPKPVAKPDGKPKRDWWKLAKDFVNMYKFFSVGNKYGKHSTVRNPVIAEMTKSVLPHLESIKSWILSCMGGFVREMQIFPDLNLGFNNNSGKLTIQGQSQKIMALLKILVVDIAKRSSNANELPAKIQELIYKYIREKAYYPKKFLTSFVVNRVDFNFFGGTKNLSDAQVGMICAFLIISKTLVQQVMLYPKHNFEQFKNFKSIEISCRYLGSILHYITRDAFNASPPMVKEILALLNYYRNYHIYNEQVEKQVDIFSENAMVFRDQDELAKDLIPESSITEFFNMNAKWCAQMKSLIYQWACNLARQIKVKYSKFDKNLEKKPALKPKIVETKKIDPPDEEDDGDIVEE